MKPSYQSPRNVGIDLLRGLSIVFVVIHHMAMGFRLPLFPSLVGPWLGKRVVNGISFNGYESVFVFFVLSGFLITQRLLAQPGQVSSPDATQTLRQPLRDFYRARLSRIAPLLLLLLVVLTVLHWLQIPGYVIDKPGQTLGGAWVSALLLHLNWYEAQTTWLPASWDVLWSLSIEEVFYLAFPLLWFGLPRRWLVLLLMALALSLPWVRASLAGNELWQEKAYLPGMSAIAFGVLTALLAQEWQPSNGFARGALAAGAAGLVGVFFFGDVLWRTWHDQVMLLLCASASMVVFAADRLKPAPLWGLGWLAGMGRLSYEIYLSHMFIVLSVCSAYRAVWGSDMAWAFAVYVPTLAACGGLGLALERWVSVPARRWLHKPSFQTSTTLQNS